jgi:hypothetical protein
MAVGSRDAFSVARKNFLVLEQWTSKKKKKKKKPKNSQYFISKIDMKNVETTKSSSVVGDLCTTRTEAAHSAEPSKSPKMRGEDGKSHIIS